MLNFSVKMTEPKSFIRVDKEGEPQLVLVCPVIKDTGLDPEHVAVFLDEEGPHIVPRAYLPALLAGNNCVPVEAVTNFKNWVH